jgi:hypothetical protein
MAYVFVNPVTVALYVNAHACTNANVFTTLQLAKHSTVVITTICIG